MKREGRQHGSVRTYCILPSSPLDPARTTQKKSSRTLGSPPTAGIFTKVPTKPTNHSKFTGKCGRARCTDCHLHPAWKSKDKIKGARAKLRSSGLDLGHGGLLAWRVTGKYDKVKLDSQSASEILGELYSPHDDCDDGYRGYLRDLDDKFMFKYGRKLYGDYPMVEEPTFNLSLDCLDEYPFLSSPIDDRVSSEIDEVEDQDGSMANGFDEFDDVENDDDDDDMGFFDVAIVWEPIDGDEGWSLVGEM